LRTHTLPSLAAAVLLLLPASRPAVPRPERRDEPVAGPVGTDAAGLDRHCPELVCSPPAPHDPLRELAAGAGRLLGDLHCRIPDAQFAGTLRAPAMRVCVRVGGFVVCGAGAHSRAAGPSFGLSLSGIPGAPRCGS